MTSGSKIISIPMSIELMLVTATKEGTIQFLEKFGERLKWKIESIKNLDEQLKKMQKRHLIV